MGYLSSRLVGWLVYIPFVLVGTFLVFHFQMRNVWLFLAIWAGGGAIAWAVWAMLEDMGSDSRSRR